MFRGERVKIHPVSLSVAASRTDSGQGRAPATPEPTPEALVPGEVAATKRAVRAGTASGDVVLGQVQPQGKRPMDAADWARGVRLEPGEKFADE